MTQPTRLVVIVGVYFLIIFTASTAYDSILTKILEEEQETKLTPFIFICNYTAFMVASQFVPLVKVSEKWLIVATSLFRGLKYSTGFFIFGDNEIAKYLLTGFGATLAGIAGAFLWVSVGRYIHKACHIHNKQS